MIVKVAQAAFPEIAAYADSLKLDRTNASACLHIRSDGEQTLPHHEVLDRLLLGDLNDPKLATFIELASREKPDRLVQHPDHRLSRESSDPENGKYPGAVRFPDARTIISISGLPADLDEATSTNLGIVGTIESLKGGLDLMHDAGNRHFTPVHQIIVNTVTRLS